MRYLLDECLTQQAAAGLTAFAASDGQVFGYLAGAEVGCAGAADDEIPGICRKGGWDVLVLRPGRHRFDGPEQLSMLAAHYREYTRAFAEATDPILVVVTDSGVRRRTLAELVAEIEGGGRGALP